jgi:hypothetical protein
MVSFNVFIYILNSTLLIVHEIDSAYWKEWELFGLPGGISGFLLLHVPIVMLLFFGLIGVYLGTGFGYIVNIIVAFGGVFAFCIHSYFIRAGNHQFKTTPSQALLYGLLVTSVLQIYLILKF